MAAIAQQQAKIRERTGENDQRFNKVLADARADRQRIDQALANAQADRERGDRAINAHRAFRATFQTLLAEVA